MLGCHLGNVSPDSSPCVEPRTYRSAVRPARTSGATGEDDIKKTHVSVTSEKSSRYNDPAIHAQRPRGGDRGSQRANRRGALTLQGAGIGHAVAREAPDAFTDAVVEVGGAT